MPELKNTTTTTKVLRVVFSMENNSTITFTLQDPKDNLTLNDVKGTGKFGDYIINESMLLKDGLQAVDCKESSYYTTQKVTIDY